MKKTLLLLIASLTLNLSYSQVADSVTLGAGYTDQVFYELSTGTKTTGVSSDWDLQFFASVYSASIRVNSGFGVVLYSVTNPDTANFSTSTLDTIGKTNLRGDNIDWEHDAFTITQTGHPNYGWGHYGGLGNITGNKVFAIKLTSGAIKKIWINSFATSGQVDFTIADLDGTNLVTKTVNRNTYNTKRHFYYDVEGDSFLDSEPVKGEWDLVFRKYEENLGGGQYYAVTGALSNYDREITEIKNVEVGTAKINWSSYPSSTDINIIGQDWKAYQGMWVIEDSLSYIIKDANEDMYQVIFTGTGGSSNGKMYFTTELISAASVEENSPFNNLGVYPNPVNDVLTITYEVAEELNNLSFTLVDINGKIVKALGSQQGVVGFNQGKVSLSDINSGVYLLNITTDNYSVTKRIIKK
jgi:hypothetical protein